MVSLKQEFVRVCGFEDLTKEGLLQKALSGEDNMVMDAVVHRPHIAPNNRHYREKEDEQFKTYVFLTIQEQMLRHSAELQKQINQLILKIEEIHKQNLKRAEELTEEILGDNIKMGTLSDIITKSQKLIDDYKESNKNFSKKACEEAIELLRQNDIKIDDDISNALLYQKIKDLKQTSAQERQKIDDALPYKKEQLDTLNHQNQENQTKIDDFKKRAEQIDTMPSSEEKIEAQEKFLKGLQELKTDIANQVTNSIKDNDFRQEAKNFVGRSVISTTQTKPSFINTLG